MYAEMLDDDSGLYSGLYDVDSLGVMLGAAIYISGLDRMTDLNGELIDDPVGFAETIQRLDDPTTLDRTDGVTTLEATLHPPADLVEAFGHPIPTGVVQLDLDAFDIPQAMRLEVSGGASRFWIELRFDGWGDSFTIELRRRTRSSRTTTGTTGRTSKKTRDDSPAVTAVEGITPVRPNASLGSWQLDTPTSTAGAPRSRGAKRSPTCRGTSRAATKTVGAPT